MKAECYIREKTKKKERWDFGLSRTTVTEGRAANSKIPFRGRPGRQVVDQQVGQEV